MRTLIAVVLFAGAMGVAHAAPPAKEASSKVPTLAELDEKMAELEIEFKGNQVVMSKEGFMEIIQYVKAMNEELESSKKPRAVVCYKASQQ